jgi:hypothetical protein
MCVKFFASMMVLGFLVLFLPQEADGKAWRGIVPLHSTRADVERLWGPANADDSSYEIDGGRVLFVYSSQGCQEGLPGGWNIAVNTVISISVSSTKQIKLADVLVAGKNFDQIYRVHTPQLVDYVDTQEGVRYAYVTIDDSVQSTTYFGSETDDKKLRCGVYKYAAPVPAEAKNKFEQVPYDSFGKIPFEDVEARLDNFAAELQNLNQGKPHYRGFIIVYAGRSARAGEAGTTAECSRNYLVSMRKFDPDTIIATDGGYRDEFQVELYIIPNDAYPPLLMPTVSPKKVEILPGAAAPCSN